MLGAILCGSVIGGAHCDCRLS